MATHVPKRSLILTFDAFGTLIKPRKPISIQYREEAEKFGLKIMTQKEADLEFSFRKACTRLNNVHPNNGGPVARRRTIGFQEWWSAAITETLTPFSSGKSIPRELIDSLIKRFSSSDGYELYPDVLPFLQQVSNTPSWRFPPAVTVSQDTPSNKIPEKATILGVLSNGDPRIPLILKSLDVAPYFSFYVLAYDHGVAKPARELFRIARLEGMRTVNPGIDTRDPETKEEVPSTWRGFEFAHVGDDLFEDWVAARKLKDFSPIWLDRSKLGLQSGNAVKFQKSSLPSQLPPVIFRSMGREWALMSNKARAKLDPNRQLSVSTVHELSQIIDLFPVLDPKDEVEYYDEVYEEVRNEKDRLELHRPRNGQKEADAQVMKDKGQFHSRKWNETGREIAMGKEQVDLPGTEPLGEERQHGSKWWDQSNKEATGERRQAYTGSSNDPDEGTAKIRRIQLGFGDDANKEGAHPGRWKEPTTERGSWERPARPGAWNESTKGLQGERQVRPRRWDEPNENVDMEEPVSPRRWNQSAENTPRGREFRSRGWNELNEDANTERQARSGRWNESNEDTNTERQARSGRWNESNEDTNTERQARSGRWNEPTDRFRSERQAGSGGRGEFSEGQNQMGPSRWGERNDNTRQTTWRNDTGPSRWNERNDNTRQAGPAWRDQSRWNENGDKARWQRPEPRKRQTKDMNVDPSEIERIHRELSFNSRPWPSKREERTVPERNERRIFAKNLMEKYPDDKMEPETAAKPRDESQSRY